MGLSLVHRVRCKDSKYKKLTGELQGDYSGVKDFSWSKTLNPICIGYTAYFEEYVIQVAV